MPGLDEVRKVKESAESDLLRLPGVTGIAIAYKYVAGIKTDELSIRVFVQTKQEVPASERVPPEINGVPTDVVERRMVPFAGPASAPLLLGTSDLSRYDPLVGGISIGPCRENIAGTLGMIVLDDATDQPMILSNFHVLAFDNQNMVGDNVVQPGRPDGGNCPQDVVGLLQRSVLGPVADAAVATLSNRDHRCTIQGIGAVTEVGEEPSLDMPVRKRGRTTGLTSGFVDAIDKTVVVNYDGIGPVTFTHQIEIRSEDWNTVVVDPGFFLPGEWTTLPVTVADNVTVERTGGAITVIGSTGAMVHQPTGNNVSTYMVFGSPPAVLIHEVQQGAGPNDQWVTVVDFSTAPPSETLILHGQGGLAQVQVSQGTGTVFLIYSQSGTTIKNLRMCRSRDGLVLCPGPPPFTPTGDTRGEATQTDLIIHYSSGGQAGQAICSLIPTALPDPFALQGDSGSIVVDDDTAAVGLLFAGSRAVEDESGGVLIPEGVWADVSPIAPVLSALGIRLCNGGGGGSGGGIVPQPPLTLSVRRLAVRCLGHNPPISLRQDIFAGSNQSPLSLRAQLLQIRADCR